MRSRPDEQFVRHEISELRRGVIGVALGVALGALAALFAREDEGKGRRWRGRSAT